MRASAGTDASQVGLRWLQGEPFAQRDGSVVVTAPWGVVRQKPPQGRSWRIESSGALRLA